MTLRDTRFGRWARRHERTHKVIHATWCRMIGPFDVKRVATTSGKTTGGNPISNYSVYFTTSSAVPFTSGNFIGNFNTQQDAVTRVNQAQGQYGYYYITANYADGTQTVVSGAGPGTGPPGGTYIVTYPPCTSSGCTKYTATTSADALAWAKANAPVGVTYNVFQILNGQRLIYTGLGTQTTAAASYAAQFTPQQALASFEAQNPGEVFGTTFTDTSTGAVSAAILPPFNPPSSFYLQLLAADGYPPDLLAAYANAPDQATQAKAYQAIIAWKPS